MKRIKTIKRKKSFFSGDLGSSQQIPLLKKVQAIKQADYVVIESTYGDRIHEDKKNRKDLLENVIEDTITSGGTLMIPAFALERTQELIYELNELVEHHRIPKVPVFIDSPLAINALEVYKKDGLEKVIYITASNPCPICSPWESRVLTLHEAEGLIPQHGNCLCMWIPYTENIEESIR